MTAGGSTSGSAASESGAGSSAASDRSAAVPVPCTTDTSPGAGDRPGCRESPSQPLEQRNVIAAAEGAGNEDELGAAVGRNVGDLGLAIDRRDRVDHEPAEPHGQRDHRRLDPVRELERYDVAGP